MSDDRPMARWGWWLGAVVRFVVVPMVGVAAVSWWLVTSSSGPDLPS